MPVVPRGYIFHKGCGELSLELTVPDNVLGARGLMDIHQKYHVQCIGYLVMRMTEFGRKLLRYLKS